MLDKIPVWTFIAAADYKRFTMDRSLADEFWKQIQRGFEFTLAKVDTSDSLLNVTDLDDWGLVGQGGKTTAANTLLYHALDNSQTNSVTTVSPTIASHQRGCRRREDCYECQLVR